MSNPPPARHQRSAKNYLLDRQFQLKYASFLSGIVLTLSVILGLVVYRTGSDLIVQGQETVKRGKEVVVQSRKVSQVVSLSIAKEYKDDPALAKQFEEDAAKDEQKWKDEQDRLERDAAFLAEKQRNLLVALVAILGLMVVGTGLAGIVFTHKVAGPIFKMKRLLREVGEGKLIVRERLRKGDELVHFFETFEKMVGDLRKRQEAEIARVDAILEKLSDAPVSTRGLKEFDEDGIEMLRKLRAEMQDQLDG